MYFNLVLDLLIVWRITHLINSENGPFDVFQKFRKFLQRKGGFYWELVWCFLCLSVWVGIATSLIREGFTLQALPYGLALSGGAILLNRISGE